MRQLLLHVLHVLLQHHDVVGVLLARHVDPQIPGHPGLVVAYVTPPAGLLLVDVGKGVVVHWITSAHASR